MNTCENCGCDHSGEYGSGRFCSSKCSKGFSGKGSRGSKKPRQSKLIIKYFECITCKSIFSSHKLRKFCSKSCSTTFLNKNADYSKRRKAISEGVTKSYQNGKPNYGGRTKWLNYNNLKVQGTYELRACKILDKWKSENKIKNWEYTNDRIEYVTIDGRTRNYLLDFKIFTDYGFYYLEVKGYATENDYLKWKTVKEKGFNLVVWFDDDLKKNE
jgi:hypothetical protein